jgi:TonB-linked SusC/RagA family outer membrane protein
MKKITLLLVLLLVSLQVMFAQRKITGIVTNEDDGAPLPGVTVVVKGIPSKGTITDLDGKYSLDIPEGTQSIVFSFVGMRTKEVVTEKSTEINVAMTTTDIALDDVVVTGYGVQRKREVTGAISQVKGTELASLAAASFESNLTGKSTGVQISTTSGLLGKTPDIKVRGTNSITSGTYPLVVVDGMPIFVGNLVTSESGAYTNSLGDINPTDIESIEVLKDGSATAIYGSRAANGVILITTKKGAKGKFKVTYNNYIGFAQTTKRYSLLGADDFIAVENERLANATTTPATSAKAFAMPGVNTDWQKEVFRDKAYQQDHNLSLSGATDKTNYYISLGLTKQDGISYNNDMNRYSFRMNLEQKATSWLNIGTTMGITRTVYNGLNTGENSLSGNVFSAIRSTPNVPVMDANNPTGYNIDVASNTLGKGNNLAVIAANIPNIKYILDQNSQNSKITRILGNIYADATFLKDFKYRTQFSVDAKFVDTYTYWNPIHGDGKSYVGYLSQSYEPGSTWNLQNILSYGHSFGQHNFSATAVSEIQYKKYSYIIAEGDNISDPFFKKNLISGSFAVPKVYGFMADNGFVSTAGRINYNYASKYFFQASIRRDGLSRLPSDNRYGMFPGVSVGWTLSEEQFLAGIKQYVSDLKLRASYAEVGNDQIGNYPYLGTYSAGKYGNSNGIGFYQMGNNDLKWEASKKTDIGLDLALFGGKFKINFDYYKNDITDLIMDYPTPPSLGVPYLTFSKNIGSMKNTGYEFSFDANVLNMNGFVLNLNANLSLNKNEVTALVDGNDIIPLTNPYVINRVGESLNSLYGYNYGGVNPANGNGTWIKADGSKVQYLPYKGTGTIAAGYYVYDPANPTDLSKPATLSASDMTILGEARPTYFGSFGLNAKYKGLNLEVTFRYSGGNKIFNKTREDMLSMGFQNNSSEMLDRWQSTSSTGNGLIPKQYAELHNAILKIGSANTLFLEDGNYVRLQTLKLSYDIPQSILAKIHVENLRLFVQGQNLMTFTKYKGLDPDMSGNLYGGVDWNGNPLQRVLTFGVNFGF